MEDEQSYVDNFFWQIVDKSAKGSNITLHSTFFLPSRVTRCSLPVTKILFSPEKTHFLKFLILIPLLDFNSPFG